MKKRKKKISIYGKQLREKQDLKKYYGLKEKQFRRYVEQAQKRGQTANNLVILLESRIDVVVYRLGFAKTIAQARQWVSHGRFVLNGRRVYTPSILLQRGDKIAPRKKEQFEEINPPKNYSWLNLDKRSKEGQFLSTPVPKEVGLLFDLNLVVQFYSR